MQAGLRPIAKVENVRPACLTLRSRAVCRHLVSVGRTDEWLAYLRGEVSLEELERTIPPNRLPAVMHTEMSRKGMPLLLAELEAQLKQAGVQTPDLISGGPPCQGFSLANRHRTRIHEDPRNGLWKLFLEVVRQFLPRAVLIENVPGMLSHQGGRFQKEIVQSLEDVGYDVESRVLNAADHGVSQHRRRLFIIGAREGAHPQSPQPMEGRPLGVSKLLASLPPLRAGGAMRKARYVGGQASRSGLEAPWGFTTLHHARMHSPRDKEVFQMALEMWNGSGRRMRWDDIPQHLWNRSLSGAFADKYRVVDGKGPSHTITAHIASEGIRFIHPDAAQCRSLTVREAARIQGFPDSYHFEGSRTAAFRQIGNAVPPPLATALGRAILGSLGNGDGMHQQIREAA